MFQYAVVASLLICQFVLNDIVLLTGCANICGRYKLIIAGRNVYWPRYIHDGHDKAVRGLL